MPSSAVSSRSEISCHCCRRRKVKCDRSLPRCLVCQETSQPCHYPSGPMKPGPKIGAPRRPRKRARDDRMSQEDDLHHHAAPFLTPSRESSEATEDRGLSSETCRDHPAQSGAKDSAITENLETPHPPANILDLSFILHPSHEASSPDQEHTPNAKGLPVDGQESIFIQDIYSALGVTRPVMEQMIKTFFENMVAIILFQEPTFPQKLRSIESEPQLYALLAAMLAYAVRFYPDENHDMHASASTDPSETSSRAERLLSLAFKFLDQALRECGDQAPTLCILQAYIIATLCQLTQGVLGRAWRSLGSCVRLAYEMNLHLIDMKGAQNVAEIDPRQWCCDEEKRRAWWAVWEMDVFATTIRRTPTAMDWSQIETLLPVEDEYWFRNQPRKSCFLEQDPTYRWKALQESGNQSSKAWFIVINSLMKDAQKISSPRGIPTLSRASESLRGPANGRSNDNFDMVDIAHQRLETIANAVQCFILALPAQLRYRNQYLGFDARKPGQLTSLRLVHSSIHNISAMTQLTKLMIYRYEVFGGQARLSRPTKRSSKTRADGKQYQPRPGATTIGRNEMDSLATRQYFEAADNLVTIVNRSCEDHICYMSPFLSYTIWLGSTVQLVQRILCPPGATRNLMKSRFEVLHLTYKKCVNFWDIQFAVQQNLETLEVQVESCLNANKANLTSSRRAYQELHVSQRPDNPRRHSLPGQDMETTESDISEPQITEAERVRQSSIPGQCFPTAASGVSPAVSRWQTGLLGEMTRLHSPNMYDSMHLPLQLATQWPNPDQTLQSGGATLLDFMANAQNIQSRSFTTDTLTPSYTQHTDWNYAEVPDDLYSMLSEFCAS